MNHLFYIQNCFTVKLGIINIDYFQQGKTMIHQNPPVKSSDLKQFGIQTFRIRDYYKALGYFSLAYEHVPSNLQLLEWKIKCFYELKQYEICLKYVSQSQIVSSEILIIESKVYLDKHDFSKIAQCCKRIGSVQNQSKLKNLLEQMRSITNYYNKFVDFQSKDQYKDAIQCLNQLISRLPPNKNTVKLRIQQLQCLIKYGQLQRAKVIFQKLPKQYTAQLYCLKLKLVYYLRDEVEYKNLILKGHKMFPQDEVFLKLEACIDQSDFHLKQGNLLLQYKRYKQAINTFTLGLGMDPFNKLINALFHFKRGTAYRKNGQIDKAKGDFIKSIQLNPNNIQIRKQNAVFSLQNKKFHTAILDYEKLIEIDSQNKKIYQKEIKNIKKLEKEHGKIDYYKRLNIQKGCTQQQIKKAYKKMALNYHPDRNRNKSASQAAQNTCKFMEITEAYKVLMNPSCRKLYDAKTSFQQDEQHEESEQFSCEKDEDDSDSQKNLPKHKKNNQNSNNSSDGSNLSGNKRKKCSNGWNQINNKNPNNRKPTRKQRRSNNNSYREHSQSYQQVNHKVKHEHSYNRYYDRSKNRNYSSQFQSY